LTSGFAIPYGKCFLCGGDLEVIRDRNLGDSMGFQAIRDAVQFELNAFHFYKLARDRSQDTVQRAVLERMYEAELDHFHELEQKYHVHLEREAVELSGDEEKLLANWLFEGIRFHDSTAIADVYRSAIEMEIRTRDHFRQMAQNLPPGIERDLCAELAAEEEEHVALLMGELEQIR
jgi:rubrerythrin